ncbi:MAG: Crp/Fnr family transcriptional regulator [Gammaproteobacteria bacterium HGW-Gammaproteobacteria-12]|nr:MAG: Crp/Fnr family transcriptional regulator [Gammaproteobacteria bacterium HGW-Gammaproteobacteria-12]
MSHVYFPVDALISLLYQTEHGTATELSVVGYDGMVGIALSIGGENLPSRAVVQRSGHAFRLKGGLLKDEFDRHGQAAVCIRHHSIDQQLCRLLLLWLDHLPGNAATVPQELLGDRPGSSRTNMVSAADKLKRQGIIDYGPESITVLDRHQLEQLCCECYGLVKRETERLQLCVPQFK